MTKSKKMHTSRNVKDKVLNFHRVSLSPDQLAGHYEKYVTYFGIVILRMSATWEAS